MNRDELNQKLRELNRSRLQRRRNRRACRSFAFDIRRDFRRQGLVPPRLRIVPSDEPEAGGDLILRREGGGVTVLFDRRVSYSYLVQVIMKTAPFVYWFERSDPSIPEITVNGTDGEGPTRARYAYCSNGPAVTALPDSQFFDANGYADTDRAALAAPSWDERGDDLVWRGRVNNLGYFTTDPAFEDHPGAMQRMRMALKCRQLGVDFRFVPSIGQPYDGCIEAAGLMGGFVPVHDWAGKKFAIDIDGFTNAWSNFLQRLKLGCCVLKIDSPFGFTQWYYHKLQPWEHYVPVRADLSDLAEQIDWLRSHDAEAREIAARGQAVARTLTFESETHEAARLIAARETQGSAR